MMPPRRDQDETSTANSEPLERCVTFVDTKYVLQELRMVYKIRKQT